jgi:peptide/nickel transport system permease protein
MRDVWRIVLRRLLQAVPVILGITFYLFFMLELSPVDPRYAALGLYASEESREQLAEEFQLDDPFTLRYVRYVGHLVEGDLGVSIYGKRPIVEILGERIGVTLTIAGFSLVVGSAIAFGLGVSSAYFAGTWWDAVVRTVTFGSLAIPVFWLALLLIQFFALGFSWLPAGGWVPFSEDPVGWLRSLALPTLSIALPVGGFLTRVVRSSVLDELDKDYVRTARGTGLRDGVIVRKNVLRNALIAPLTVLGLQAGYLLGGAVLVELVFNLPGLGLLMMTSSATGDFPAITGVALIAALMFILANLAADLAFVIFKPSARET